MDSIFCLLPAAMCEEPTPERHVFPVARDGKIGFIDQDGKLVLPCEYSMYTQAEVNVTKGIFWLRKAEVIANDNSLKDMDELNMPGYFCYLPEFHTNPDRIIPIVKDGKIGFLHENGTVLVEPRYIEASFFNRGRAWVRDENGKYLFLDATGKILMDEIEDPGIKDPGIEDPGIQDQRKIHWEPTTQPHPIKKDGKWVCMDWSGKLVIPCQFDKIGKFSGITSLFPVYTKEAGYSRPVERVTDCFGNIYDYTYVYHLDKETILLRNRQTEGCKVYSEKKGWETRQEYGDVGILSEGLRYFRYTKTPKYGYMDENENVVIPPQFDLAYDFRNGLALVGMKGSDFVNRMTDLAGFPLTGLYGYINTKGEYVWEPSWGPIPKDEINEVAEEEEKEVE